MLLQPSTFPPLHPNTCHNYQSMYQIRIRHIVYTIATPLFHSFIFIFFYFFFVVSSYLHKYGFTLRSRTICLGIYFTLTNKTGLYPLWYSRFTNAAQLASFRIYPPTQASFLLQSEGTKKERDKNILLLRVGNSVVYSIQNLYNCLIETALESFLLLLLLPSEFLKYENIKKDEREGGG